VLNIGLGLVKQVADVAKRAGSEIMRVYQTDFQVETKGDNSPVTAADQAAENIILRSIREGITDAYPVVSEEAASAGRVPEVRDTAFWLVDPLDGTKEFINRNGEFTVNIALIENTRPVLGVVHVPVLEKTYMGASMGAFLMESDGKRRDIACRPTPGDGLTAVVSRSHRSDDIDDFLANYTVKSEVSAGSSLKFCSIAEGSADIYPRLGRTMEWDTAAGHAVLRFAGGSVVTLEGPDLGYGKPGFENPHFVAAGPDVKVGG